MATYDPVLERKMFKAKEKPSKGKGIADLGEENSVDTADMSDYEARRQMAMQMLDAAREKHDPSNFKTLAENERPMVFRPTAVNLPQPQQPVPAAQQMARMQAAGIRPVGMAHGGAVRYGYAGNNGSFVTPNGPAGLESLPEASTLSPTQKDRLAQEAIDLSAFNARTLAAGKAPEEMLQPSELTDVRLAKKEKAPYSIESNPNVKYNDPDDPTTWSPDFREAMVDKIVKDRKAERDTIAPDFRSYVKEPTKEDVSREIDFKAVDIRRARGDSPARSEAAARERAMPDKRDYGQEREAAASGIRAAEDQSHREQAMPDKRDYGQEREGLASINRGIEDAAARERAAPDKRDYGQEREANKGIAALGNEVRTGNAPGAAAEAARPAAIPGVPGASVANGTAPAPATGGDTGAGGPATGEGAAKSNEPAKYAPATTLESIKADRAKEREDNFNMALINAGLAMMGGKSSNALVNIGEGGMQGIKQFSEAQRETNRGYREDVKGIREENRAAQEMAQRERMQGETLSASAKQAELQRGATAELAAAQRASTERMFGRTEDRLKTAHDDEFGLSKQGMQLKKAAQDLDEKVRNKELSLRDATLEYQKKNDDLTRQHDTEKMQFLANQPPDTVKMYTALGGGDLLKGYYTVQDAAMHSDRVRAAQDILNPMSGASEDQKQQALNVLSQLMMPRQSVTGAFKYSGSTPKAP